MKQRIYLVPASLAFLAAAALMLSQIPQLSGVAAICWLAAGVLLLVALGLAIKLQRTHQ